jgi:sugar lactone lactonase YvrE
MGTVRKRHARGFERGTRLTVTAFAVSAGSLALLVAASGAGAGAGGASSAAIGSDMPAWSPDGERIAFVGFRAGRAGDIYTVPAEGGREQRLTATRSQEDLPRWSPDGRQIVFARTVQGTHQLFVMSANGSGQRQLTTGGLPSSAPAWSPGGERIAFVRGRVDADTGDGLQTDGTETGEQRSSADNGEIYVMNANGGGETRLTHNTAIDNSPTWSPDGTLILFTSNRAGTGAQQLFTMRTDGSDQRKLTDHPVGFHNELRPAWSPDGSTIAFVADRDPPIGNTEIYAVDANGTNVRRLTNEIGSDDWPTWSPDGWIAISRGRSGFRPELFVIGNDGLGARKVTGTYLRLLRMTYAPRRPRAGRPFVVELAVHPVLDEFTDTECTATAGDRLLADAAVRIVQGRLRCVWRLPRSARGKRLKGVVLASSGGSEIVRKFSLKVG